MKKTSGFIRAQRGLEFFCQKPRSGILVQFIIICLNICKIIVNGIYSETYFL